MYRVLDLFAGAGGMSLGFLQAGKYDIALAIEKNENAQATYKQNHQHTALLIDILDINNYELFQREYGTFDVVVGGPPCQGFSNANRQKNHIVSQNNSLVKKYVEVIENLKPKAFVMENVRMLKSDVHRFYCSHDDGIELGRLGIATRYETICLLSTECPVPDINQYLLTPQIISEIVLPEKAFYSLRMFQKNSADENKRDEALNKKGKQCIKTIASLPERSNRVSEHYIQFERTALNAFVNFANGEMSFEEACPRMTAYIDVQRMMMHAKELLDNRILIDSLRIDPRGVFVDVNSYSVIDYIKKKLGELYIIDDGILNAAWFGAPQLRERYIAMGLRKDLGVQSKLPVAKFEFEEYRKVYDAIVDLETVEPGFSTDDEPIKLSNEYQNTPLTSQLRDSNVLFNHITTETREKAKKRFEALQPGQNFHDLDRNLIEDTYTRPERTQNSIYLRLEYGKPCGTVTNVRKSMWIHPTINRAISIREAARLQTFPDSYKFIGTKDSQYQQIGNAVPPIMAKAIAKKLAELLDACNLADNEQGGIAHSGYVLNGTAEQDDVQNRLKEYNSRNDRKEVSA
ncbi:DNA cytosine methyltransferase [Brevibacillus centrosporus]|uniref:DNA cytosine methyltransferase n=1 Tax=Brevibacillus centrosporus TaxID=54910 RepID=UPI0038188453